MLGRTTPKGMPRLLDAALLAEAFGEEIVFERPPRSVQRALAITVAPIARRRGRSVTDAEVIRAGSWRRSSGQGHTPAPTRISRPAVRRPPPQLDGFGLGCRRTVGVLPHVRVRPTATPSE